MTISQLTIWIRQQLEALGEPSLDATADNAAIVSQLKLLTCEAGLYDLSLSLPVEATKRKVSAVAQLRRVLDEIKTPPAVAGGGDMSVIQAAALLGVSKETVYGLCASGDMECNRIGKRITITPAQLTSYRQSAVR
jgi:excisionase family DNA binding protein